MRRLARLTLAVLVVAGVARADTEPNAWEAAKDPGARGRWELHVHVARFLEASRQGTVRFGVGDPLLEHARALLEGAGARTSPDVRLRFDLGVAYELSGRHREAVAVLQPAVDEHPDAPGVEAALSSLAYAYARLDQPHGEIGAYHRYLRVSTSELQQATAVLNLAEAEMRIGELGEAIAGYRDAEDRAAQLGQAGGVALTTVLAAWGLAVALDRAGDPAGATREARRADSMDPEQRIIGDDRPSSNVFFEPKRERYWYTALGAQEDARAARSARDAVRLWETTVERWSRYVRLTEVEGPGSGLPDWLALAKAHLEAARRELASAQRRLKKEPAARVPGADVDL